MSAHDLPILKRLERSSRDHDRPPSVQSMVNVRAQEAMDNAARLIRLAHDTLASIRGVGSTTRNAIDDALRELRK